MEWIQALVEQMENPLVRLVAGESVRGIVRRVRRGRRAASAHSEAGPITALHAEGMEAPVTIADDRTGEQLAEELLRGVGNERMRAATRLLGAHRGGHWLRRLLAEELELTMAAGRSVIDRGGAHPSVDWDVLGHLMLTRPGVLKSSTSEWIVLQTAVSLAGSYAVQLGDVVQGVSEDEVRMIQRALEEAAFGDAR
ncbi:hypothetical protein [Streptomyces botrytidirepellens]|uniref:Uncharacterized protein n=1 Tax=Streptomyces botrytidirepellens TaxID=2486417 RepID=A0A3M8WIB9_9ACTN|nr:hypothetical protein [Streptomyces botrytidirepellens]RNG27763.1 hypothetical protein EEJ42_13025 [Streptomyces botrytidirepellens]